MVKIRCLKDRKRKQMFLNIHTPYYQAPIGITYYMTELDLNRKIFLCVFSSKGKNIYILFLGKRNQDGVSRQGSLIF